MKLFKKEAEAPYKVEPTPLMEIHPIKQEQSEAEAWFCCLSLFLSAALIGGMIYAFYKLIIQLI